MKNTLEELRQEIENTDAEMVSLFETRMMLASEIAKIKKDKNIPVCDSQREKELLHKNVKLLTHDELTLYYNKFFQAVVEISKDYQYDIISKE